jgi:hypothetical protein
LTFPLDPDDVSALEAAFGKESVIVTQVTVSRRYESNMTSWAGPIISEAKAVGQLLERSGLDRAKYEKETLEETVEALQARAVHFSVR